MADLKNTQFIDVFLLLAVVLLYSLLYTFASIPAFYLVFLFRTRKGSLQVFLDSPMLRS